MLRLFRMAGCTFRAFLLKKQEMRVDSSMRPLSLREGLAIWTTGEGTRLWPVAKASEAQPASQAKTPPLKTFRTLHPSLSQDEFLTHY